MNIEQLRQAHADSLHAIQQAENALDEIRAQWMKAISQGADDAALDEIDVRRLRAERAVERRRIAEQQAHGAIVKAEQEEAAKHKKAASDSFIKTHGEMQSQLDAVEAVAKQYAAAVAKLEAMQGGYFDAAVTAQQFRAKPQVSSLRIPLDVLNEARKASGIPATLNSRFC